MASLLPLFENDADAPPGQVTEQRVAGTVTKVVFSSADGLYVVLRADDRAGREFTMVGALDGLAEGEDFEAEGVWEQHKEYGRQFRANRFKAVLPSSTEGIRRYLSSGILPGIGEVLAGRIVDKFGAETLNILDKSSARLREVSGFGKHRLGQVRAAWQAQTAQREQDVYLQGLGISAAYCRRIAKHFGGNAAGLVKANPYRLTEVRGIGFRLADAVARRLGIASESPARLAAGAVYVMQQLTERDGHCCVPEAELLECAAAVLEVNSELARQGLARTLASGDLVAEDGFIYPKGLYFAERELAELVRKAPMRRLSALPKSMPVSTNWRQLNDAQQQAVRQAFRFALSIITGGPGVGKTTVTREIVHVAGQLKLKVALAAPTGRAAKRLSEWCSQPAQTLHRLLRWEPESASFHYGKQAKLPADLIIVDEASMLDLPLALHLFQALGPEARLVLVGDHDQLPSVGPGTVLGDLIASKRAPVTQLREIFRQAAGSRIITNAHRVNAGEMPELQPPGPERELQDFYWLEQDDPEKVLELIRKMVAERIPRRFGFSPATDIQVLTPMNRGICGARNLNAVLQDVLNPATPETPFLQLGETRLRPGDRLMQVVNNYDLGVFNGDLGTVMRLEPALRRFTVLFDSGEVSYSFAEADQVRLAYAITIHKSQGSEFPVVVVPLLTGHFVMLQRNLVYTAMTRASRLLVMIGSPQALSMAVRNFKKAPRYTRLAAQISQ